MHDPNVEHDLLSNNTFSPSKKPSSLDEQHISDKALRGFLLKNLLQKDLVWEWKINLKCIIDQYLDIAAAPQLASLITNETMFIRGDDSDYISVHDASIDAWFKHARIQTVLNAGHWVHAEAPDTVFDLTMDFLE